MRPTDALARRDAQEIELAPPTWMTLTRLSQFETVDDLLADARRRPPTFYETRVASSTDGMIAMWDGDAGYATGDPQAPGPRHRLHIGAGAWRLERNV